MITTIRRATTLLSCLLGAVVLALVTSPIAHAQIPPDVSGPGGRSAPATPIPAPVQDGWPVWATVVITLAAVAILMGAVLLLRSRLVPRFRHA